MIKKTRTDIETVVRVAIPSPLRKLFDYRLTDASSSPPKIGARVRVPFGRREVVGVVVEHADDSSVPESRLRRIIATLDDEPLLGAALIRVLQWAAGYYHHPPGEVWLSAFPTSLRKGVKTRRAVAEIPRADTEATDSPPELNSEQDAAVNEIIARHETFAPFLLEGVTGSGKTEIYQQLTDRLLKSGKRVLVLVPEIGLTPQIVERFRQRFGVAIAVLHSGMGDAQRAREWISAQGGEARIIIGTRSAVFTPIPELGMIVVDEEHDGSFKQQEGFRYHARDVAVMRAREERIPIVLGSATPSLESLLNARSGRYRHVQLTKRAGAAVPPEIQVIDIRRQPLSNLISKVLHDEVLAELNAGHQVMLFLNRRGFAPTWFCHDCGWIARCSRCDVNLVVHQRSAQLRCHHCGAEQVIPKACPKCRSENLHAVGTGTERVEQGMMHEFERFGIARIDRDTTRRKGTLESMLADAATGRARLLIGTQMLAKGHHFPAVTLVGILNTDQGLLSADFRASERMAQLLVQVAGRAGRGETLGRVAIQTACPEHPLLSLLLKQGYPAFATQALAEREAAELPPFSHLALIRAEAAGRDAALAFLGRLGPAAAGVTALGPTPAPMEKRKGHFRAQLLLLAKDRGALHRLLTRWTSQIEDDVQSRRVRWTIDVDPMGLF